MTRSRGAVRPVGLVCLQRTGGGLRRRAGEDWPEEPAVLIVESVDAGPRKSGLIVGSWTLLRIALEAGQRRLARRAGCNDLGEQGQEDQAGPSRAGKGHLAKVTGLLRAERKETGRPGCSGQEVDEEDDRAAPGCNILDDIRSDDRAAEDRAAS
ncbi:hypothetical protein Droror1_Dr00002322 [Drosera rotundifolia]